MRVGREALGGGHGNESWPGMDGAVAGGRVEGSSISQARRLLPSPACVPSRAAEKPSAMLCKEAGWWSMRMHGREASLLT